MSKGKDDPFLCVNIYNSIEQKGKNMKIVENFFTAQATNEVDLAQSEEPMEDYRRVLSAFLDSVLYSGLGGREISEIADNLYECKCARDVEILLRSRVLSMIHEIEQDQSEKEYYVVLSANGYEVVDDKNVIAEGLNNAEAWRLADRMNLETTSRSQDVSEWAFKKDANR